MNEKHPDRTKEWQKQQEALKSPKTYPSQTAEKKDQKSPSIQIPDKS